MYNFAENGLGSPGLICVDTFLMLSQSLFHRFLLFLLLYSCPYASWIGSGEIPEVLC